MSSESSAAPDAVAASLIAIRNSQFAILNSHFSASGTETGERQRERRQEREREREGEVKCPESCLYSNYLFFFGISFLQDVQMGTERSDRPPSLFTPQRTVPYKCSWYIRICYSSLFFTPPSICDALAFSLRFFMGRVFFHPLFFGGCALVISFCLCCHCCFFCRREC